MSGPERRTPDDEMLDRYLDGHSDVSRAYRQTAARQPPAELDRRILDLARSELQSAAPTRAGSRRGIRWRYPLAAAAVIVLSFSVLINLQQERALPTAIPEVPVQRQIDIRKEAGSAPEQEASVDAIDARPPAEARAAPSPAPAAPAAAAAPIVQAEPPTSQQKAERDAEQERRSERDATRKRLAADAPAALIRSQAIAADGASAAAPPQEKAWSCQEPDAQWARIRRLFAGQQPEQARDVYRELESACPDVTVPEDLRDRLGNKQEEADVPRDKD